MNEPVDISTLSDDEIDNMDINELLDKIGASDDKEEEPDNTGETKDDESNNDDDINRPDDNDSTELVDNEDINKDGDKEDNEGESPDDSNGGKNSEDEDNEFLFKDITIDGKKVSLTEEEARILLTKQKEPDQSIVAAQSIVKSLEDNGIDLDTLNLLIDARKGKKSAIAKLAKMNDIDLLDVEEKEDYKPDDNIQANDNRLEQKIQSLSSSKSFKTLISEVGQLDDESKAIIEQNPYILDVIHETIETGEHDRVMRILSKDKMLGAIPSNVSDLAAYEAILTKIREQDSKKEGKTEKKKAAKQPKSSQTKSNNQDKSNSDKNVWDMNEDEFDKFYKKLINQ